MADSQNGPESIASSSSLPAHKKNRVVITRSFCALGETDSETPFPKMDQSTKQNPLTTQQSGVIVGT